MARRGLFAQIRSMSGFEAHVEIRGVGRTTSFVLTPEARVGCYVLVPSGYAISVVDEGEALESLSLLQQLANHYPLGERCLSQGGLSVRAKSTQSPSRFG